MYTIYIIVKYAPPTDIVRLFDVEREADSEALSLTVYTEVEDVEQSISFDVSTVEVNVSPLRV